MRRILVTGGLGLIGTELVRRLRAVGVECRIYDVRATDPDCSGDVCDLGNLKGRMAGCDGVVHLAAVSRVIWGEQDPQKCWSVNRGGTINVLQAAHGFPLGRRPWVVYGSSREVYGEAPTLPASEDTPLKPVNIYGWAKLAAEEAVVEACSAGLIASTVRFSNVYGSVDDHTDRVVPAFARAASEAGTMRIDGGDNTFDFTHVVDVVDGLVSLVHAIDTERKALPPIHFVSGRPTTLLELAEIARSQGAPGASISFAPSRNFDVSRFYGDPTRATQLLGWRASTPLNEGVGRLVADYTVTRLRAA